MSEEKKVTLTTTYTNAGTYTFIVPEGVTEITIEISGAGAGGYGRNRKIDSGGGQSSGEGSGGEA